MGEQRSGSEFRKRLETDGNQILHDLAGACIGSSPEPHCCAFAPLREGAATGSPAPHDGAAVRASMRQWLSSAPKDTLLGKMWREPAESLCRPQRTRAPSLHVFRPQSHLRFKVNKHTLRL
jgi:hypothetical protein